MWQRIGLLLIAAGIIAAAAWLIYTQTRETFAPAPGESPCYEDCLNAQTACPGLVELSLCTANCERLSETAREYLREADSCAALAARPDLLEQAVRPAENKPEPIEASSACDRACENYVNQCLTLVPNATQALFDEGTASCLEECAGWNQDKIECLAQAVDCESMTDQCGL